MWYVIECILRLLYEVNLKSHPGSIQSWLWFVDKWSFHDGSLLLLSSYSLLVILHKPHRFGNLMSLLLLLLLLSISFDTSLLLYECIGSFIICDGSLEEFLFKFLHLYKTQIISEKNIFG